MVPPAGKITVPALFNVTSLDRSRLISLLLASPAISAEVNAPIPAAETEITPLVVMSTPEPFLTPPNV